MDFVMWQFLSTFDSLYKTFFWYKNKKKLNNAILSYFIVLSVISVTLVTWELDNT